MIDILQVICTWFSCTKFVIDVLALVIEVQNYEKTET